MQQVFEALLIALLTLIAFILYLIFRELNQLRSYAPQVLAEERKSAQSITVNVGSNAEKSKDSMEESAKRLPVTTPVIDVIDEETKLAMLKAQQNDRGGIPQKSEQPARAASRATESGVVAKKCPSCNMENSSYRSECFNCGSKL